MKTNDQSNDREQPKGEGADTFLKYLKDTAKTIKESKQFLAATKNVIAELLQDIVCEYELSREEYKAKDAQEPVPGDWISVEDGLPEEGGRYWCYVEEINDLGISHFQWNCSYHEVEKRFSDRSLNGGKVTHWQPLPAPPNKL